MFHAMVSQITSISIVYSSGEDCGDWIYFRECIDVSRLMLYIHEHQHQYIRMGGQENNIRDPSRGVEI